MKPKALLLISVWNTHSNWALWKFISEFPFAQQEAWAQTGGRNFCRLSFSQQGVIGFPSSMSGSTHSLAERWERCWANTQTQGRGQRMLTGRAEINTNPDISTHSIPNQNIERVFRYILWTEAHLPIYKIHIQIFYHKFWQNPNSTKQCKLPPEPHNTKTFNKIGGIHTFDSEFLTNYMLVS